MRGLSVLLYALVLCSSSTMAQPYYTGSPLSQPERTICGKDDMVLISKAEQEWRQLSSPIGILDATVSKTSGFHCSGTLIDKDIFITARHCKEACDKISVRFGFHSTASKTETFKCREILEIGKNQSNQDYMVLRLEGSPGVQWGWYPPSDREMKPNDSLMVFHHPSAKPMHMSLEDCTTHSISGGMLNHHCDTLTGSSGAGVLTRDDNKSEVRLVGVHAFGGCASTGRSNSGPSMKHLVTLSALLRSLVKD